MSGSGRVDVHQHVMPPVWMQALAAADNVPAYEKAAMAAMSAWSPEEAMRAMDAVGTQLAVLSVTSPGVHLGDADSARRLARAVNEYGAEVAGRRPDRFGFFASVALPEVDAAVTEAVYALDELSANGVCLLSNVGGQYLGDPALRPLWEVLNARGAVVFIHPAPVAGLPDLPGTDGWADWPFDTTRTALHMVVNGVMRDFDALKVILSHAGGFLPYQAGRFEAIATPAAGQTAQTVHQDLRRFYFDTALSSTPATLAALTEFAGPDHIVFGTDWPAAPLDPIGQHFATQLDTYLDHHPEYAEQINHRTAEKLLPRITTN